VFVEVGADCGAHLIIKQVVEQRHKFRASHCTPSPFFFLK
jgi:hypothetical protein